MRTRPRALRNGPRIGEGVTRSHRRALPLHFPRMELQLHLANHPSVFQRFIWEPLSETTEADVSLVASSTFEGCARENIAAAGLSDLVEVREGPLSEGPLITGTTSPYGGIHHCRQRRSLPGVSCPSPFARFRLSQRSLCRRRRIDDADSPVVPPLKLPRSDAAAVLMFAALLGSYLPARKAIKVDPVEALRAE
jgi:hypothetical protein